MFAEGPRWLVTYSGYPLRAAAAALGYRVCYAVVGLDQDLDDDPDALVAMIFGEGKGLR